MLHAAALHNLAYLMSQSDDLKYIDFISSIASTLHGESYSQNRRVGSIFHKHPYNGRSSAKNAHPKKIKNSQSDIVERESSVVERTLVQMADFSTSPAGDGVVATSVRCAMRFRNGSQGQREGD